MRPMKITSVEKFENVGFIISIAITCFFLVYDIHEDRPSEYSTLIFALR